MVIEGEAGIGKTALLDWARAAARERGMHVFAARGSELEVEYPFGIVRQCLEPVVRRADAKERRKLLSGVAALAAPVLLDVPGEAGPASFGTLHGLYWLVASLAERQPLVIAIDDAHWADEPSLQAVAYLIRRVVSLPLAVVVTTRPRGEVRTLADLVAGDSLELLALEPLGESAVAELLRESSPEPVDEEFARACHHASGGNPFLLTELARSLREERVPFSTAGAARVGELTPPQVARATRARLARLDAPARALARAIVVLGDDPPLDLLSELAGLEQPVAVAAADALAGAGLIDAGRLLHFRHPLLRSAVAASLTLAEQEASHREAARLLRARGAAPERVAVHLLASAPAGHDSDRATLHEAAARTVARGAQGAAVPLFRRLLEDLQDPAERAEVLLDLGRAEFAAGRIASAREHLEGAYRATDPLVRARALALLLQATADSAAALETLAAIPAAIDALPSDGRELALRLQAYAMLLRHPGAPSDLELAELSALPGETPGEAVVLAHLILRRMSAGATAAEIAELARRAACQVDALVADGTTTTAFSAVILGLRWTDRLDEAERVLGRAVAIARRRGSTIDFANALGLRGEVYVRRGMLRDAEADARTAQAAEVERDWRFPRGLNALLQSLVAQGRTAEAAEVLEAELGDEELADMPPMLSLMLTRAQVRAAMNDHAGALAEFYEAIRRREKWGGTTPSWIGDLLIAAESHTALGYDDAARSLLAEASALAARWGTPGALGQVARANALVGRSADRIETLHEAVGLLEQSPAKLELARALVDLGSSLRRAGHRSDSRTPLRNGYDLARECAADTLAESARRELAASGIRIRRERLTGAHSLTPSERRIAEIAAGGSSNAEIAQALFVTVKTVEMHLTHIYRKLQISGRNELAPALQRGPTTSTRPIC